MQNVWRDGKLSPFVLLPLSGMIAYISYGRFMSSARRRIEMTTSDMSGTKIILNGTTLEKKK
jgi:hypothetical protein